jgi:hypothetical protein
MDSAEKLASAEQNHTVDKIWPTKFRFVLEFWFSQVNLCPWRLVVGDTVFFFVSYASTQKRVYLQVVWFLSKQFVLSILLSSFRWSSESDTIHFVLQWGIYVALISPQECLWSPSSRIQSRLSSTYVPKNKLIEQHSGSMKFLAFGLVVLAYLQSFAATDLQLQGK